MRTITADKLPSWFSLSKYLLTNTLGLDEWYENLVWRSNLLALSQDELKPHREFIKGYFYEKEGRKLVWTVASGARRYSSPGLREKPSKNSLITTTVSSMAVGTVASFIATSRDDESVLGRQLSKAASVVQETNAVVDIEIDDAAPDGLDEVIRHHKKQIKAAAAARLGESFDELERSELSLTNEGTLHVEVNLFASDKLILADFKSWLGAAREKFKMPARSEFSAASRQAWVKARVLPYLDLTLWSAMEQVTIPEEIMLHALYGEVIQPEGKLNRTVKKHAHWLIRLPVLLKMAAQIENRMVKPSK